MEKFDNKSLKWLLVAITVMVIVAGTLRVNAATVEADEEAGTNTYSIDYFCGTRKMSSPSGYWKAVKVQGTVTTTGYKACIVRTEYNNIDEDIPDDIYYRFDYYVYNSNGYTKVSLNSSYFSRSGTSEDGLYNGSQWYEDSANNPHTTYNTMIGSSSYSLNSVYDSLSWCYFKSSMPIFDTEEQAIAFMNGEITEKDAVNYEDIAPALYGVLEVPQNIKVSSPLSGILEFEMDYDINITWTQTDENYLDWDTEILVYASFKTRPSLLGISFADWTNYDDKYLYQEDIKCRRLKYVLDSDERFDAICEWLDLNSTEAYNTIDEKEFIIFMRNKYFDGSNTYYSNWVKVYVDMVEDAFYTDEDSSTSLEEIEYGDSSTGDSGKDFTQEMPDGNINPDSDYDGSVIENANSSVEDDILGFISNGFGLQGDNGLIAMMQDAFSYIPEPVWIMIYAGVGVIVLVGILKYVF